MRLLRPLVRAGSRSVEERYTLDDYVGWLSAVGLGGSFAYNGTNFPLGLNFTQPGAKSSSIGENFAGYVNGGLRANGIVWTCANVRLQVFSQARFMFQRMRSGVPDALFSNPALALLERPWPGATTADLLAVLGLHADFAGNAYCYVNDGQIVTLRPDWTDCILEELTVNGRPAGFRKFAYVHYQDGQRDQIPAIFPAGEVAHYAPYPDPLAPWRGMSWLTPVVRDITSDSAATKHKQAFYDNAATPNLAVSLDKSVTAELFEQFVDMMEAGHKGIANAGKTLYLGGGADLTVVGQNMQQLDFKAVQGAGETRIAAASGVGAVVAQLSEGMQGSSLNAGNYSAARRRFSDVPMRHAWQNVAGSLQTIIATPSDARLWYDARDIAFLQEDESDAADIWAKDAQAIRTLTDGGYEPDTVIAATKTRNHDLLKHTGKLSVQLQAPGESMSPNGDMPADSDMPAATSA